MRIRQVCCLHSSPKKICHSPVISLQQFYKLINHSYFSVPWRGSFMWNLWLWDDVVVSGSIYKKVFLVCFCATCFRWIEEAKFYRQKSGQLIFDLFIPFHSNFPYTVDIAGLLFFFQYLKKIIFIQTGHLRWLWGYLLTVLPLFLFLPILKRKYFWGKKMSGTHAQDHFASMKMSWVERRFIQDLRPKEKGLWIHWIQLIDQKKSVCIMQIT